MTYQGYTIEPSTSLFGGVDYFETRVGRDEESVKRADTVEEAIDSIDDKIMEGSKPYLITTTVQLGGFKLKNITKFAWLSDAVKFAARFNGEFENNFQSI